MLIYVLPASESSDSSDSDEDSDSDSDGMWHEPFMQMDNRLTCTLDYSIHVPRSQKESRKASSKETHYQLFRFIGRLGF
jgi:hypothetical protein